MFDVFCRSVQKYAMIQPGDQVNRYENGRDRIGQVILTGKDLDACETRLDDILSKINIEFTV